MTFGKFFSYTLEGEPLIIYGNGNQIRTNSYISDIAHWTLNAARLADLGATLILSGSRGVTINEVCHLLGDLPQRDITLSFLNRPLGDQNETRGNIALP